MNSGDQAIYQGYEVCLWPLEYLGITAGADAPNHIINGVANSGLYDNGWYLTQVRKLYAPCTIRLVATSTAGNTQMWVSKNPVWLPGYPDPQYITIGVSHCNNPPYSVIGTEIAQGAYFYSTGDYGASASHVHFILEIGIRTTMFPVGYNSYLGQNIYYSPNPPGTIADMFYLLPTDEVRNTGGYTWTTYEGEIIHPNKVLDIILYSMINRRKKKHGKRIYT